MDFNDRNFRNLVNDAERFLNEAEVDVPKLIADLGKSFGGSNEEQMKAVQLLKGLALSDDPLANKFMKALDTATTTIAKKMGEE